MCRKIVRIAIDGAAGSFDRLYSYLVPENLSESAVPGCRVTIPFGRGDSKRQGMIFSYSDEAENGKLKQIYDVTDTTPVLNDEMLKMCEWMKEHTFCSFFDAVHTMLPTGLNYKLTDYYYVNEDFVSAGILSKEEKEIYDYLLKNGETSRDKIEKAFDNADEILGFLEENEAVLRECTPVRKMGDLTKRYVRLLLDENELSEIKLTDRQREIAQLVVETGSCAVSEIQYFTGVSASVIDALIKKGVLESFEKEVFRTPKTLKKRGEAKPIVLTDEQQAAFDGLSSQLSGEKAQVSLLYGVTGSGKTQVFLKLVDKAVEQGLGVIVMVPEIALTPQIINIFSNRYGSGVAVFHSAMSLGQRMDEYKRIKQGKANIAIGTRSAVFAPFSNLGLIIIDEEQEHTYKSEKSPRFHARDVAKFRVAYHKGLLCLASATPSIETYSNALSGRYGIFKLTKRYGSAVLPSVTAVDMKKELSDGNSGSISTTLYESVSEALSCGKQAIILLNRRGHNTYITCPSCGYIASCPNCSVSLTYHSANRRLMCHYCGYSEAQMSKCPQCGNENVRFLGVGTQKIEEDLSILFPSARIVRMDADSTITRESYTKYLTAFANGEYDIMIGTQMVAKGLDFPNVTVVGVIGADRAMYSEDYRSFERTFSLLTQVVGRAGRGGSAGQAVIQSTDPENSIITLASMQDYDAFYNEEIMTRKVMTFPPFCDICVVCVTSAERGLAEDTIREIFDKIRSLLDSDYNDVKTIVLGPAVAAMPKVNNRYRYRLTVKCRNNRRFREMLRKAVDMRLKRDASVSIDINPETVI